jgi:hypothetical protein
MKLPRVPQRFITTEEPRQRISESDRAAPYVQLGKALDTFAGGIEDVSVVIADQAGKNAVERAPDGTPTFAPAPLFSGAAGRAYNRSGQMAHSVEVDNQANVVFAQLRAKHANDPEGFRVAAESYRDGVASGQHPDVRMLIRQQLDRSISGHVVGVINEKFRSDTARDQSRFQAAMERYGRDMTTLGESGKSAGDPAFDAAKGGFDSAVDSMVRDPRFGLSAEAGEEMKRKRLRDTESAIVNGSLRREYNLSGDLPATMKKAERLFARPEMNLTPQEQSARLAEAERYVRGAKSYRDAEIAELSERSRALTFSLRSGAIMASDTSIDEAIRHARRVRRLDIASQLESEREIANTMGDWDTLTEDQKSARVRALRDKVVQRGQGGLDPQFAPVVASGKNVDLTKINPPVRDGLTRAGAIYGDAFQITSGNDSKHADGSQHYANSAVDIRVRDMTPADRARAVDALVRAGFTGIHEDANHIHADMRPGKVWRGPTVTPDVTAALDRRKFTSGADPITVDRAGGSDEGSPALSAVRAEGINRVQARHNADARAAFDPIKAAFAAGQLPRPDEIIGLSNLMREVNDPKLKKEVIDLYQTEGVRQKFDAMPEPQRRAHILTLEQAAREGEADPAARKALDYVREREAARMKIRDSEPLRLVDGFVTLPPEARELAQVARADLNTADSAQFRAGLAARQKVLNIVSETDRMVPRIALTERDQQRFKADFDTATPNDAARMLGDMAITLDPQTLNATLAKIVAKDQSASVMASAGVIMQQDPNVGMSIVRGAKAAQAEKGLSPKEDSAYRTMLNTYLPVTMMVPAQRDVVERVALARYADLSRAAGDVSAVLNTSRLQQAINEVTGGVLDYGGFKLVAPWRGATSGDFRVAVRAISPDDLAGAVHADGTSVSVDEVRSRGKFQSVGDGRYAVFFGPTPETGIVGRRLPDGRVDRFIVDLRGKRPIGGVPGSGYVYDPLQPGDRTLGQ